MRGGRPRSTVRSSRLAMLMCISTMLALTGVALMDQAPVRSASSPGCGAKTIAGGLDDGLALGTDATVWAWGRNQYGELGNGTTTDSVTPVHVQAAGGAGQLDGAVAIAGGTSEVLRSDGTVWTWGLNAYGELGNGSTVFDSTSPVQVVGPSGTGTLSNVAAIASGGEFSLALTSDGTVFAWGFNSTGELGNGAATDSTVPTTIPVQVLGPAGSGFLTNVVSIAAGFDQSFAITADGALWGWGDNDYGELGVGPSVPYTTTPMRVVGPGGVGFLTGISAVSTRGNHTLALRSDGTVWAFGSEASGELGNGQQSFSEDQFFPVQVLGPGGSGYLTGVTAVEAGAGHSLAMKSDGTVWGWGGNAYGAVGSGGSFPGGAVLTASPVLGPNGVGVLSGVTEIAAGFDQSLALKADGTLWAWGDNQEGDLGDGTGGFSQWSFSPVEVSVPLIAQPGPACQAGPPPPAPPPPPPPTELSISVAPTSLAVSGWTYAPNPFTVTASIQNTGSAPAGSPVASIQPGAGLSLVSGEGATQTLADIPAGMSITTTWQLSVSPQFVDGTLSYVVSVSASNSSGATSSGTATVPRVRPLYVAFGDSITTGYSIETCNYHLANSPWGCTGPNGPATPYPDVVAQALGYSSSDSAAEYRNYTQPNGPGFPPEGLDRVGIWGSGAADADVAFNHADAFGPWEPQLNAVLDAQNLVTGGLGINDLRFDDVGFWLPYYLQDQNQCLVPPFQCGTSMQQQATRLVGVYATDFQRVFDVLKQAHQSGVNVIVTLYYDPISQQEICTDLRNMAEILVNTVDTELQTRANSYSPPLSEVDFRPVFDGHGMMDPNPYVFGTNCDNLHAVGTQVPSWVPFAHVPTSAVDPHPNNAGAQAMADAILKELGR